MTAPYGKTIQFYAEGASRDPYISCCLRGLPAGIPVDTDALRHFMARRAPGHNPWSTSRREPDVPEILSGITDGKTDGSPIRIRVANRDADKTDAIDYRRFPRPSHADYPAVLKYGQAVDLRGGGRFSGRLTALLCAAGGICLQYLRANGIRVYAHLASVGTVKDETVDPLRPEESALSAAQSRAFPVLSEEAGEEMIHAIARIKEQKDSLGGNVECVVLGLPAGLGEHMFAAVETAVSEAVFAIPGVKGIEFGEGFASAVLSGSQNNDGYRYSDGKVVLESNRAGGILGGMTTGAPLLFRAAFKPTPTVGLSQHTVDLKEHKNAIIAAEGRNDPCYVPRAVPAVEAAAALAVCDLLLSGQEEPRTLEECRQAIDKADEKISAAFRERVRAVRKVAAVKRFTGDVIYVPAREEKVLRNVLCDTVGEEEKNATKELYAAVFRISRNLQKPFRYPQLGGYSRDTVLLLGNPLGHTLSPQIHARLCDYTYTPLACEESRLEPILRSASFLGCNVTIPYKKTIIPFLDSLSEEAAFLGAVNTVVKRPDGTLCGYNTDVPGFEALLDSLGLPELPKKAVILGNGGAAAAVRYVLSRRGIRTVLTATRKDEGTLRLSDLTPQNVRGALLINCTPCGMFPEEGPLPLSEDSVRACAAVVDLVYNPLRTRLVLCAREAGLPAVSGLGMLISQARKSAELFTQGEIRQDDEADIRKDILEEQSDIVLVGMPGAGKTTVGKTLADITGRRFFDTDEDFRDRTGYSPADYLRRFGEPAFRKEESVSVRTAAHLRGAVIATGGGAVLSAENRYRLQSAGTVFFLDRPLSSLPDTDRPLSKTRGTEALYRERLPLYRSVADETVKVTTPGETAAEILRLFESAISR